MDTQFIVAEEESKHWLKRRFQAHLYKNVFDDKFYNLLKRSVLQLLEKNNLSYAIHRTVFDFEGETKKIVSHNQNGREQQVVYDMTFDKDWWYQTSDTIKDWSNEYLRCNINPVFYKYLKFFEEQPPFSDDPNCWIPFRWHINILTYNKYLGLHMDMNDQYFNTVSACEARARSLTYYFEDHIEGYGGEFWTDTGFVFKPMRNHAICINGNEALHGVCANMNPNKLPRMAFTVRWAHKDDLYLPGHPNKTLYKLEW